MKKIKTYSILALGLITLLTSCGGGSVTSNEENPSTNTSNDVVSNEVLSSEEEKVSQNVSSENSIVLSSEEKESENKETSCENNPVISESDNTSNEIVDGTKTDKVEIVNYGGDLEAAFAEFYPVKNATGYNAYYKEKSSSNWTNIDTELIRNYDSHYRVDAIGLKAGKYDLKITPIISNNVDTSKEMSVEIDVKAHQREGYAFVDRPTANVFGAYNDDGTLRSGAKVFYVTKDNAKTITYSMNGNTYTGFQDIIYGLQKVQDPSYIINMRIIGTLTFDDVDELLSSAQGLQIKGRKARSNLNLTIEGVGKDATINGFGMLIRNCANVEIRNLGIMNFLDDGISIDTDNKNIWIHNNDFFYGQKGSASDQAKGDGSLDTKGSSHITHSYNHFWDSGKCNLQGMKDETTENCITYHHNWFDHSDSRHPRVRTATVHIFNNYYDGNSKYGIGATSGCSLYVEGNYFRKCKYPMLISLQGSDISGDGDGTFSGEEGGIIKAYDNEIIGATKFVPYSANITQFDAYVVEKRNDTVPSSVKTVSGSNTYSNFDTAIDFYSYTYESPLQAKETVTKYAGRVQGGDFKWEFTSSDDTSYDVNNALKTALQNYKTALVSVGGNSKY